MNLLKKFFFFQGDPYFSLGPIFGQKFPELNRPPVKSVYMKFIIQKLSWALQHIFKRIPNPWSFQLFDNNIYNTDLGVALEFISKTYDDNLPN